MPANIFLQSEMLNDIEVLIIEPSAGVDALREACLAKLPGDIDKAAFYFFFEDDDDDQPLDKLKDIPEDLRIHLHRLKGIDVQVRYAGRDARRTFRPSATVGRVKRWSTHELGIPPSDAAEMMLQITGTSVRPDSDVHIGTLVQAPECKLSFDLVPSIRVNG
jgi:hypothetical protein